MGKVGRQAVLKVWPKLKKKYAPDAVIANAENLAHGDGATIKTLDEMREIGIDYFTSGNHIFKKNKEPEMWQRDDLIRPLNYPVRDEVPGKGFLKVKILGERVWLVNLQGLVYMSEYLRSPFEVLDDFVGEHSGEIILVDFHAEATSEKVALGLAFEEKVTAIFGTHTHIQTADERILTGGAGYISDTGMCGPRNGVIGIEKDEIIRHFHTGLKFKNEPADFPAQVAGVVIEIDPATKKTRKIKRIFEVVKNP
ncbi:MAG: hypothetical protein CEN89_294 [Candidatus Berkelbacteria bacterium Licking1014_7]|uniref:Metallophosphoesterase n=1 Tax=Candidatus Berkelbacteria bacterium Licking1014_7 TaxID=2017147 RepID=A0A554LJN0_9BACT|nr:MAG: hypothetical protein CEN89_294 [Candidatus Berkelbacteria bacterium Licking1014_7]